MEYDPLPTKVVCSCRISLGGGTPCYLERKQPTAIYPGSKKERPCMSATPRDFAFASPTAATNRAALVPSTDANTAIPTLSDCPCALTGLACPVSVEAYLPNSLLAQLHSLGRSYAADLPTTLLAAFAVCLARYLGQSSIHISAGLLLPQGGDEAAPPAAVAPASFDVELGAVTTFGQLLASIVDQLPQPLAPSAGPKPEPTKLTYQRQPRGCTLAYSQQRRQRDGELRLGITQASAEHANTWIYHIGQIEPTMLTQLHQHFQVLLEGLAADPAQPLARLPLLAPAELRRLLVDWNASSQPYDTAHCILELFEAHRRCMQDEAVDARVAARLGDARLRDAHPAVGERHAPVDGPGRGMGVGAQRDVDGACRRPQACTVIVGANERTRPSR